MAASTAMHRRSRLGKLEAAPSEPYERTVGWLFSSCLVLGALVLCLFCVWLARTGTSSPLLAATVPAGGQFSWSGQEGDPFATPLGQDGPDFGLISEEPPQPSMAETLEAIATQPLVDWPDDVADQPSGGSQGGARGADADPRVDARLHEPNGGPSQRWAIEFEAGGSLDDYARQLDYFGIELGVVGRDGVVDYATALASSAPGKRGGHVSDEERLWFSWQDGSRRDADRTLLRRAGIVADGQKVFHFYPHSLRQTLAALEAEFVRGHHPGKSLRDVYQTTFRITRRATGYEFYVSEQRLY